MARGLNKCIEDDFEMMKKWLDEMNKIMKTHINKVEVMTFYSPIKNMMFEALMDLHRHGRPTFTNENQW